MNSSKQVTIIMYDCEENQRANRADVLVMSFPLWPTCKKVLRKGHIYRNYIFAGFYFGKIEKSVAKRSSSGPSKRK